MLRKVGLLTVLLAAAFAALILTARDRTFTVENSLLITAPPSTIWRELAMVHDWPQWWPGVEEAHLSPGWEEGAILDLVLTGTPEGKPARVSRMVPERRLVWQRQSILGSTVRTSLGLTPVAAGTRASLESHIHGPQAVLAKITADEDFSMYHDLVLRQLKERVARRSEKQP